MSALLSTARPLPTRRALGAGLGVVLVATGLLALGLHSLDALSAAGLTGTAPAQGATAFQQLIATLKGNTIWLISTGLGLGLAIVALMYFLGSMRAPDALMKIGMAVAILLVGIPALLA